MFYYDQNKLLKQKRYNSISKTKDILELKKFKIKNVLGDKKFSL